MRFGWIIGAVFWALPALSQDFEEGIDAFANHCAGCHGTEARGDGPMAALLRVAPPDLTQLSAGNDGTFPLARVIERIDGTTEVMAHGGPMPLFGLLMHGPSVATVTPDGREIVAPEVIVGIAEWLATQQE